VGSGDSSGEYLGFRAAGEGTGIGVYDGATGRATSPFRPRNRGDEASSKSSEKISGRGMREKGPVITANGRIHILR